MTSLVTGCFSSNGGKSSFPTSEFSVGLTQSEFEMAAAMVRTNKLCDTNITQIGKQTEDGHERLTYLHPGAALPLNAMVTESGN